MIPLVRLLDTKGWYLTGFRACLTSRLTRKVVGKKRVASPRGRPVNCGLAEIVAADEANLSSISLRAEGLLIRFVGALKTFELIFITDELCCNAASDKFNIEGGKDEVESPEGGPGGIPGGGPGGRIPLEDFIIGGIPGGGPGGKPLKEDRSKSWDFL